jgi:site-specific recombinase XerC
VLVRSLKSSANGFLRTILSGLRTFITETSKRISTVGGSLRDIQMMVGHSSLQTTQRYIEADSDSQRRIVDLI